MSEGSADDGAPIGEGTGFSLGFVDTTLRADDASAPIPPGTATPAGQGYVLHRMIGVGGQGEVWEAWQSSLQRIVAVKVHRSGSTERFLREALLTGELDHPAIVPVLDLGTLLGGGDDARPAVAMAMKRLRGVRWDELVAQERGTADRPSTEYLLRHLAIVDTVCRAVAYAHSRGVVHLDLKPSQVIVGEFGEVYLCDWGMAARIKPESGRLEFLSPPNGPFGTPGFMAPEQALFDEDAVGVATDVYLLGGLVQFIATGRPPHPGESLESCIAAARRNVLPDPHRSLPPSLARVVARAMAATPAQRFADAESLRRALVDATQTITREAEAVALCQRVEGALKTLPREYAELAKLEQSAERALALLPDDARASDLRERTFERHARVALGRGDLALARAVAERMADATALLGEIDAEASASRARERQRVLAQRLAIGALGALVVVLVVASGSLLSAFRNVESERGRAEDALVESRRELARASIQAAVSYLTNKRPADAREALKRVPHEMRGWEWGYLASMATPEEYLLLPRAEKYSALAVSGDGTVYGAIDANGQYVDVRNVAADDSDGATSRARWTALGDGSPGRILVGTAEGDVQSLAPRGRTLGWSPVSIPIRNVAALGAGALVVDSDHKLWRVTNASSELLLEIGEKVTVLSSRGDAFALGTESGDVWHGRADSPVVRTNVAHTAPVRGIEWAPDGTRFVTWAVQGDVRRFTGDSRAIVHAVGEVEPVRVTVPVDLPMTAAAWSPDGTRLSVAFANAWLHELDTTTWEPARSSYHSVGIAEWMAYLPDGARLVLGARALFQVRETQWMGQERVFRADSRAVTGREMVGDQLITIGTDGGVAVWATDRDPWVDVVSLTPDRIHSIDAARDVPIVAAAHRWGWIGLWDVAKGAPRRVASHVIEGEIETVRVSADGTRVLVLMKGGRVDLLQREGEAFVALGSWPQLVDVRAIAFSPAGDRCIASLADGGLIEMLDTQDSTPRAITRNGVTWTALEFDANGSRLFAGGADGTITTLRTTDYSPLQLMQGHKAPVRRLSYNADTDLLVSASEDETARLWEGSTGKALQTYRGTHAGAVTSALLTPDGARVITASMDSTVRVFDRETGAELVAFQDHQFGVLDMDLSCDGRRLITVGQDGTMRVWNAFPWNAGEGFFDNGAGDLR